MAQPGNEGHWSTLVCPTGKRRFENRRDARAARKKAQRRPHVGGRLSVYLCDLCEGYHLGKLQPEIVRGEKTRAEREPHQPRRRDAS